MVFLNSIYESLVDKSPQHVVMALFLALAGALIVAQLYFFVSRKVSDPQVVLTGMLVFALAIATVLGIGFERYSREASAKNITASFQHVRRNPHSPYDVQIAKRILDVADADKDGRLSPEEASQAAARYVREAGLRNDSDSADFHALIRLVRHATMPWGHMGDHQATLSSGPQPSISMERPF